MLLRHGFLMGGGEGRAMHFRSSIKRNSRKLFHAFVDRRKRCVMHLKKFVARPGGCVNVLFIGRERLGIA